LHCKNQRRLSWQLHHHAQSISSHTFARSVNEANEEARSQGLNPKRMLQIGGKQEADLQQAKKGEQATLAKT
jgi:hypothetical protein